MQTSAMCRESSLVCSLSTVVPWAFHSCRLPTCSYWPRSNACCMASSNFCTCRRSDCVLTATNRHTKRNTTMLNISTVSRKGYITNVGILKKKHHEKERWNAMQNQKICSAKCHWLPSDAMHSYAVKRYLFVCLSVCHTPVVCGNS